MGAYLDQPVKDKNPESGSAALCSWGVCSMQGWRCNMEDDHVAKEVDLGGGKKAMLFCVFDGHGGKEVANYARERFAAIFASTPDFKNKKYDAALADTFMKLDDEIKEKDYGRDTGSTACVVFIDDSQIICVNAGDSRTVLCSGEQAIALSDDHKPDNAGEQARIERANHMVEDQRVDGNLALSRALGDF